jgi:hypothetical protein
MLSEKCSTDQNKTKLRFKKTGHYKNTMQDKFAHCKLAIATLEQ